MAKAPPQSIVTAQLAEMLADLIGGVGQQSVFAMRNNFRNAAACFGHDRDARGHRFEDYEWTAFEGRRSGIAKDIKGTEQGGNFVARDITGKGNLIFAHQLGRVGKQAVEQRAIAGDDEASAIETVRRQGAHPVEGNFALAQLAQAADHKWTIRIGRIGARRLGKRKPGKIDAIGNHPDARGRDVSDMRELAGRDQDISIVTFLGGRLMMHDTDERGAVGLRREDPRHPGIVAPPVKEHDIGAESIEELGAQIGASKGIPVGIEAGDRGGLEGIL